MSERSELIMSTVGVFVAQRRIVNGAARVAETLMRQTGGVHQ